MIKDPTLLRYNHEACPECNKSGVIAYHKKLRSGKKTCMDLVYLCKDEKCANIWSPDVKDRKYIPDDSD